MTRSGRRRGSPVLGNQRRRRERRRPLVLIVTEGKNSEPEYFRMLAREFGFGPEVNVQDVRGSAPINLVNHVKEKLEWKTYDHIYCVFDMDTHSTYEEAVQAVQQMDKSQRYGSVSVKAITSVPCFEMWLFLHVKESARSFSGSSSPCKDLEREMKRHDLFWNYSKSKDWMSSNFDALKSGRDDAVSRSERILREAAKTGLAAHLANPSTCVHMVVNSLDELSSKRGG